MSAVSALTKTASGRMIEWPKLKGTHMQRIRQLETWMVAEAIVEATIAQNPVATARFAHLSRDKKGRLFLSDGDRADLNDYLFDPAFRLPMDQTVWGRNF